MRHVLIRVLLVLLAITLSTCANVSRFEKKSIVAHGEMLDGSREPLYYSIYIDLKEPVDARVMSCLLKISSDSPAIAIEKLQPDLVAHYLLPFTTPPQWPVTWKQKAKEYEAYAGDGFHIRFKAGKLISISICSHCAGGREKPTIGTPDEQHYYTLPLTEKQITKLFGSPDQIYKVNEVRY